MTPDCLARTDRLFDEAQARVAKRFLFLSPQEPHVAADERRHEQQQEQHQGPQERHDVTRRATYQRGLYASVLRLPHGDYNYETRVGRWRKPRNRARPPRTGWPASA